MEPADVKIKKKLLEKGETITDLAEKWGFTRHLLTKVIHGERSNGDLATAAQKKLARYMGTTVTDLFGTEEETARAA